MSKSVSSAVRTAIDPAAKFMFGRYPIDPSGVFAVSQHCFAFTNLKPVMPGHVLVAPLDSRKAYLQDLSVEERSDFFALVEVVGRAMKKWLMVPGTPYAVPNCTSLTITIQDGCDAGRTVPHLHAHVIPRHADDKFNIHRRNDDIYGAIDKGVCESNHRTQVDMNLEAASIRSVLQPLIQS